MTFTNLQARPGNREGAGLSNMGKSNGKGRGPDVVRPLSDILGTSDYEGFIAAVRKGGIRRFILIENHPDTLTEEYYEDMKILVKRGMVSRTKKAREAGKDNYGSFIPPDGPPPPSSFFTWRTSHTAAVPIAPGFDDIDGDFGQLNRNEPTKTKQLFKQLTPDEIRRDYMDNDLLSDLEIEGCLCSKEMLVEWALQYNKSKSAEDAKPRSEKGFRDGCTQTESETKTFELVSMQEEWKQLLKTKTTSAGHASSTLVPATTVVAPTSSAFVPAATSVGPASSALAPVNSKNAIKTAEALGFPMSLFTSTSTAPGKSASSTTTPVGTVSPLMSVSLLGDYSNNTNANSVPQAQALPQQSVLTSTETSEYEKAKQWRPMNAEQAVNLEQGVTDLYQVLVVGKGCRYRSILSEFYRITQEPLDFSKMGIPDLRTLLVQMEDEIILKKTRFNNQIIVYPNLASQRFENFDHIVELVAEQRENTNGVPDPNSPVLVEITIRNLFDPPQHYSYNTPTYGYPSASSSYNWRNPNYNNYNYYPNMWTVYYSQYYQQAQAAANWQQVYNQQDNSTTYLQNHPQYNPPGRSNVNTTTLSKECPVNRR